MSEIDLQVLFSLHSKMILKEDIKGMLQNAYVGEAQRDHKKRDKGTLDYDKCMEFKMTWKIIIL